MRLTRESKAKTSKERRVKTYYNIEDRQFLKTEVCSFDMFLCIEGFHGGHDGGIKQLKLFAY